MKSNVCILCLAIVYNGFCLAAAAEEPIVVVPAAQVVRSPSPTYKAPKSTDIEFPNKRAKIVIYSEKRGWGNRIKEYLQNDALINEISRALNVMIIAPIRHIDNREQFLSELRIPNQPERIIIGFGRVTKDVLSYVCELKSPGIINSLILFDPEIPAKPVATAKFVFGYPKQNTPQYEYISNRIYNFYSRYDPARHWRKIYPAQNGMPPAQLGDQYYFKGINIFTQVIDKYGELFEQFDFGTMDEDSFSMILATIVKTNQYRLQPDLKAIIKNYATGENLYPLRKLGADLPLLGINKPLMLQKNPPTLQFEVVHINYGVIAGVANEDYECRITLALAEQFEPIIANEKELNFYTMKFHGLNEAEKEKNLKDYALVKNSSHTLENMRNKKDAIDMVSTDIKVFRLEHDYIAKRQQDIMHTLEKMCPGAGYINIAIVASGGGSRAMFATYGVLKGLNDLGVLDATSYICGLSGSTWAISSLFIKANNADHGKGMSVTKALAEASSEAAELAERFEFLKEALYKAPGHFFSSFNEYPTTLKVKSLFNQPITNTDWYGNSIAELLLGKGDEVREPFYIPNYLSEQLGKKAQWIMKDFDLPDNYQPKLPFPIYTAITPLYNTPARLFPWVEFTPYQIGAVIGTGKRKTGMFVKTWAFGREFEGGHSVDFAPEQPLEFYLGVFGSAMNSTWSETIAMASEKLEPLITAAGKVGSWIPFTGYINMEYRRCFAEVFNPMYGMEGKEFSDYKANKTIGLIDAGLAFNLPFPPLNDYKNSRPERKPDVVIFIDATADEKNVSVIDPVAQIKQAWPNGNALRLVERYARENEVPFPELPAQGNLASGTCSIFDSQHKQEKDWPLVIYLPVTKNNAEINNEVEFNGMNMIEKVQHDNEVNGLIPGDLATINLTTYATINTNLKPQAAINLMALMQYNVLRNADIIKREICKRARSAAVVPAH